jgi:hypothetical protein
MQLDASQFVLVTKYYGHQAKEDEMDGICSMTGEMKNTHKILVRKPEGKLSCGGYY